jgi:hypothetical protein
MCISCRNAHTLFKVWPKQKGIHLGGDGISTKVGAIFYCPILFIGMLVFIPSCACCLQHKVTED